MIHEKQNAILRFWFGDDSLHPLKNAPKWFEKNPAFDNEIRERFKGYLSDAASGAFDDWGKTRDGALAYVILCDQFPRNIYRGSDQAFAWDERALKAAQIAIAHGLDRQLTHIERCFMYLPFEHSERFEMQERSLELFADLREGAAPEETAFVNQAIDFARKHYDIIAEYGRFPHRNEMLGRATTSDEKEFLKRPGSSF